MTLTKAKLVEHLQDGTGLSRAQAAEVIESILEIMKSSLENGDGVLLSGFGKFSVKDKDARRGRNPATGDDLILDPRRVVSFNASSVLKKKLNPKKVGQKKR